MSERKSIFDAVRKMLGRGFRQGEVAALDAALTRAGVPESALRPSPPSEPETIGAPKRTGRAGASLIRSFEGCARMRPDGKIEAYPDPGTGGDPWTIGWGSTGTDPFNSGRIKRGTVWTQAQADEHFAEHLKSYERDVVAALGKAIDGTSQAQFDALVSFHYNTGAIGRATLTKKHRAGDHEGAAREFARWNRAGGRVMKGLTRRRAAEAKLYRSGM